MRNSQQLDLQGTVGKLTVSELRVRDIRALVARVQSLQDLDIMQLIGDQFDEVADLLGDCIVFEKTAAGIDDLSVSELEDVAAAFQQVNAPFFKRLAQLGLDLSLAAPVLAEPLAAQTSTPPAAS